ncbi:FimV/HubP family polar landmark protein [Rhodoferax saidenbachensis]
MALSLGRLTVQSALGEPLRAEIEVPDINAEEASSLRTNVAAPEAFTAAGMEYNPAMSNLQVSLQRRANGTAYIRLSSSRPINDPFVDMILEASWASGRIVRDYTMLFDPPVLRQAQVAPTLPQISPAPSVPAPVRATTAPVSSDTPRSAPVAKAPPAPKAATPAAAAPAKPLTALGAEGDKQVPVKNGDNASKIAARTKAANVSLDQMLVALLRANPDAFVNSNLNRLRAGTVMNVPTAEQAQSVPAAEASQIVVAQSKDFNDFRRNLAANAPSAGVPAADRKASGSIDAKVEDKKPASAAPDKLTLSKGSVQSKAADDAKIAKERAEKDAATRAAEIAKNISDLDKMKAASAPKAATAPAPAASEAGKPAVPTPAVTVATTPAPAPAASAPAAPVAPASAPQAAASAPAKPKAAPVAVPPMEEPSLVDELLGDPLVPAAAGGLLAILAGLAFYKIRQRKKNAAQVDSSFLESRLQPDSFFGASGGQRVDTANDGPASNSSMVYSASQLDAADDVDPVAEADVYLAYGRDLQAEEILKEAVRTNPGRLAIHTKLLEIFAKRRDAQGFEASATQAFKLTGNASPEWARICEMGLAFDPENPLYQPGGAPSAGSSAGATESADASAFGTSTVAQSAHPDLADNRPGVDLDLDLDFSLDDEPASAISDVTGGTVAEAKPEQTLKMEAPEQDSAAGLDFDISGTAALTPTPEPTPELPNISLSMDGLSLGGNDGAGLNFDATSPMQVEPVAAAEPVAEKDTGMLEFDMGSLSLDLEPTPSEQPSESPTSVGEDPLETKLALAEEFVSIGDEDGARALIEEVVAEATGEMRAKAQRALANLS